MTNPDDLVSCPHCYAVFERPVDKPVSKNSLLAETIAALESHGKSSADVKWIGSKDGEYAIRWDDFVDIANVKYRNGYGGQEITRDLVVVGEGWWLQRELDQGYEWWDFQALPEHREVCSEFTKIKTTLGSRTIDDLEHGR